MGFDASEVMQGLDASRAMQELDGRRVMQDIASAHNILQQYQKHQKTLLDSTSILRQYQKTALGFSGIDQLQRSIQGSMSPSIIGSLRSAVMGRAGVYSPLTKDYARMRSMLGPARMLGNLSLSNSITQVLKLQGLESTYSAAWSLRLVQSFRTPALQSLLKSATAFGPIVISPDAEDAPFDYHPDLQGWLIPETATESGDVIDVKQLWAEVVAFAVGIAQHHHCNVLLSVMDNGRRFVIRVCKHPAVAGTAAGTVSGAAGGIVSGGDVVSSTVSGGVSWLIMYLLTRR